jgi:hypothetical protein
LSAGTILSVHPSATASIQSVGNGWYRIGMIVTTSNAGQSLDLRILPNSYTSGDTNSFPFAGDGFSGIYIWGAQLEAGAFATSYIPTVASQVTRSADAASMTGTNFSSWYRADAWTMYAEASSSSSITAYRDTLFDITSSTASTNTVKVGRGLAGGSASTILGGVFLSNATEAFMNGGTLTNTNGYKTAIAVETNNFAFSLNGGTVATDTLGSVPATPNALFIGFDRASNQYYANGSIKKLAYYPKRLTNAELQGLTTV